MTADKILKLKKIADNVRVQMQNSSSVGVTDDKIDKLAERIADKILEKEAFLGLFRRKPVAPPPPPPAPLATEVGELLRKGKIISALKRAGIKRPWLAAAGTGLGVAGLGALGGWGLTRLLSNPEPDYGVAGYPLFWY